MNKVILMGRLTKDPEVRYSQGNEPVAVAKYTLAVNRRFKQKGKNEAETDFISCVAFGKAGEFAEKYFKKSAGFRSAVMRTEKARGAGVRMLWWKSSILVPQEMRAAKPTLRSKALTMPRARRKLGRRRLRAVRLRSKTHKADRMESRWIFLIVLAFIR